MFVGYHDERSICHVANDETRDAPENLLATGGHGDLVKTDAARCA